MLEKMFHCRENVWQRLDLFRSNHWTLLCVAM